MKYQIKTSVTGLEPGRPYTAEEIEKAHPGLGGVDRLLALDAIEPAEAGHPRKVVEVRVPQAVDTGSTGDDSDDGKGAKGDAGKGKGAAKK